MYQERKELYRKIEENRHSKVLAYVTGDKNGMETQISTEVIDFLSDHLDVLFNQSRKISLILYSRGGDVLAAWNIINLIRMFCDEFEVIIPRKALSSATLISIGADTIIMTKQATLGPIDPSVGGPYNPTINNGGQNVPLPVSVEDVAGFFELATNEMKEDADMRLAFQSLVNNIHPLALGRVARSRSQIKKLASKLLKIHMNDQEQIDKIIEFLCSESGSHDYTINRREAENDLGLPIERPSEELYNIISKLYVDFRDEMDLRQRFSAPDITVEPQVGYDILRAFVESIDGGADQFRSRGFFSLAPNLLGAGQPMQILPPQYIDQRTKEGWEHVSD
ncbi:SDH family Clp fold serine proteinase [Desulfovibrio desulfuricans]|uniref:SDH family Clp fold serine proteinase n=1 Tax=Desulfovibrio desulfuricans TaxID=876 RepID=UPI0039845478